MGARVFLRASASRAPKNVPFSLSLLSLRVSFLAPFLHDFSVAFAWKRAGSETNTKQGILAHNWSWTRITNFFGATKMVRHICEERWPIYWMSCFWPRNHKKKRIFGASCRKRYKNRYLTRWSDKQKWWSWPMKKLPTVWGRLAGTSPNVCPSGPFIEKLLRARDLELPIFEGSLPSCWLHCMGYTRTSVHLYFPVANKNNSKIVKFGLVIVVCTILFEIITFLIRKPLNHVTVIAENSRKFLRGITSCNCILLENQGNCNCNAN